MKRILLAVSLAMGWSAPLFAEETLSLKLQPDHDYIMSGSPQEVIVKIDLQAIDAKRRHKRTPLNVAVVLDKSGSMAGAKIEKARQAAMEVVDRLAPEDMFSLIVYSDHAQVVVPSQRVEDKEALKTQILRIHSGGSTALYAGVELGSEEIERHLSNRRINRVILLSDGLANIGPSSPADLRRLGRRLSERGVSVTTIGVGDDYNEDLMSGLAEASDANYYYVKDAEKLPEIFAKELGGLTVVAAREVRIEIICPRGVRPIGFIGRPEAFEGQKASVQLSQLALAQNRYLFLRCRTEEGQADIAQVNVTYSDELNGGRQQTVRGVARVQFTRDRKTAEQSVHADVAAQKELVLTAIAKDEALACADAGQYQKAAAKLKNQAAALSYQCENAPASLKPQLRDEIDNLQLRSTQLERKQYDASTRKSLQAESWNTRNSK